jgi:3D (Asp-Asp-Asp) domain-containing protein
LNVSQSELGSNLTLLYKRGDVNTLAIVLGARSIDDAVTQLDDLNRVADESKQVVQVATAAQSRLLRLQTSLAAARARTDAAVADARRTAELLAGARAERLAFIGRLRNSERLKKAQIDRLAAVAQRVERKAKALQAAAASTAVESTPTPAVVVAPAPADGRTLTVTSTGYSLPGQTATGAPVGWGVVSVDPAVIPLGTRLTIPGYGEGVAADVGSGVHGSMIDLWFPTPMQAQAWGRRTITITLH